MACSCRTAALQIFVRSLAQVHAPATQHVRSAWLATRPRLPSRNISIAPDYRRAYTAAGSSGVVAEETKEQPTRSEDQHRTQPERGTTSSSLQSQQAESFEDDKLFSIKIRSKNAIRKASRYPKQPPGSEEQAKEDPERAQEPKDSAGEERGLAKRGKRDKKPRHRAEKQTEEDRIERQAARARTREPRTDERPMWLKQKHALKQKFPEGWRPPKRLSPDALEGIRVLHKQFPDMYTTEALADKFEVSPEAIRRILRAKWEPTAEEEEARQKRWFNRGVSVWQRYAELGKQPPRRWREAGVEASPWEGARPREKAHGEEGAPGEVDPETSSRLQARMKLSKSLV